MNLNSEGKVGVDPNINLYNEDNLTLSSYKIMIQKEDILNEKYGISTLKTAKMLYNSEYGKDITEIKKIGKNRIMAVCKNPKSANMLVKLNNKKTSGVDMFIPMFWITRIGIIKNVDIEFSEEELKENIYSDPYKIHSIRRLKRRVKVEDEIKYEDSRNIIIFFEGQNLPQYIYIWNAKLPCEPFIKNTRQCYKCLRYNHTANQCKGKSRCSKCGSNEHTLNLCKNEIIKCVNCDEEHDATDKNCKERKRQQEIKILMGNRNLSYQEAAIEIPQIWKDKNSYAVTTKNRFDILSNYEKDFPQNLTSRENSIPSYKPAPIRKRTYLDRNCKKENIKKQNNINDNKIETKQNEKEQSFINYITNSTPRTYNTRNNYRKNEQDNDEEQTENNSQRSIKVPKIQSNSKLLVSQNFSENKNEERNKFMTDSNKFSIFENIERGRKK